MKIDANCDAYLDYIFEKERPLCKVLFFNVLSFGFFTNNQVRNIEKVILAGIQFRIFF